jgi:hypothetical protein
LHEDDIAAGGADFLNQVKNVFTLLLKNAVHSSVVMNNNVVLKVGLGCREHKLDETDLGVLDLGGTTSEVRGLVVNEDETINELGVVDGTAQLLRDHDVSEVDICVSLFNNSQDSIDCHRGKEVRVLGHDLGGERGDGILDELVTVVQINRLSHPVNNLESFGESDLESIGDS